MSDHPYEKGSNQEIIMVINGPFAEFGYVAVDGVILDASSYIVWEGSTIVTLLPAYLETLPIGKHTFRATFQNGYSETDFYVVEKTSIKTPSTGEDGNFMVGFGWWMVAVMWAGCLDSLRFVFRKKQGM